MKRKQLSLFVDRPEPADLSAIADDLADVLDHIERYFVRRPRRQGATDGKHDGDTVV